MKKTMRLILSALLIPLFAYADNYKILWINSPTIKIGDKVCKEGDIFSDNNVIHWSSSAQAFDAQNIDTKSIRTFAASDFKKLGSKSVKNYFFRKGQLSSRGEMCLDSLRKYLSDEFYLHDIISVETKERMDDQHYFLVSYHVNGEIVQKRLNGDNGRFTINRSFFPENTPMPEFTLTVLYVNKESGKEDLLTNSMKIILLPLNIGDNQE